MHTNTTVALKLNCLSSFLLCAVFLYTYMTGYAGSRDCPLVASYVRVFCARNSQREGRSLPREGRDHLFQWDVGISVGFSTETTGSLRNPETRRTLSYAFSAITIKF